MSADPIADMIVKMKNAGDVGRERVSFGYSALKASILETLQKEGFVKSFEKKMAKGKPMLEVELILENRVPKIKGVKRVSKPSKRVYRKASEIKGVKQGYGALVLSTPKGIMVGREAKRARQGGEALFQIW